MKKIVLKNTALSVSKVGLGTGTSGFTGNIIQSEMSVRELANVLLYGFERGINFWDTAYTYGTYPHIAEALSQVKRQDVVICSKFSTASYKKTRHEIESTLKELKTDYIDIGLVHGVRNVFELRVRRGALMALLEAKEKGYVRHVGLSSHGLGALEEALRNNDIELVYGRLNPFGAYMDSMQEDIVSKLVAIPFTKTVAKIVIPKKLLPSISAQIESPKVDREAMKMAEDIFQRLNNSGKSVVAMKILGAGTLKDRAAESLSYVLGKSYVSAVVIGVTSKDEIEGFLRHYNSFCGGNVV